MSTPRARKIKPPGGEQGPSAPDSLPEGSAVFVKNQIGKIKFDDGTFHIFTNSKTVVENQELIEKLRAAAKLPGNPHGIFEVTKK